MRAMRSILGTTLGLFLLGTIVSAVVAAFAKQRLVSTGSEADDEFDLVTIYDSLAFASSAGALRRGSVLTWYGGGTLDLRGASLDPGGARLTIRTIFGGLQLVVPETWRVERNVLAVIGGIGDIRDADLVDPAGPVLSLDGWAVFGGIGIVSHAPVAATAEPEPPAFEAAPA